MKIFKTKLYKVTYSGTGGNDTFSGAYILGQKWLMNMVNNGTATLQRRGV